MSPLAREYLQQILDETTDIVTLQGSQPLKFLRVMKNGDGAVVRPGLRTWWG
jgi:hypothetical protein